MKDENKLRKRIRLHYSFLEKVRLFLSLIMTKMFWKKAKIIRYPHQIRGRKGFQYGDGFAIGYSASIYICFPNKKRLIVGKNADFGDYIHIVATENVTIGDNVLIGDFVLITDTSHGNYNDADFNYDESPKNRKLSTNPVLIGNNVWIGDKATILPGVKVGNNCIIGANCVVTKSIPDDCIVVGNPQRIIKCWDKETKKWVKI